MSTVGNLVFQFTTSTGTGNMNLSPMTADNPPQYYRNIATVFGIGSDKIVQYCVRHRGALEFETGRGYMLDGSTLVRVKIVESSNSNAAVNFSAGTKDVIIDVAAQYQDYANEISLGVFAVAQNNLDIGEAKVVRISGSTSINITGILGGFPGRKVTIINATGFYIGLPHQDTNSSAINRFIASGGSPYGALIAPYSVLDCIYGSDLRWRPQSDGGVLSVSNTDGGSVTVSGTRQAVDINLNTSHANSWSAQQSFQQTDFNYYADFYDEIRAHSFLISYVQSYFNSAIPDTSGVQFLAMTSASPTSSGAPLGVDVSGNVVVIPAAGDYVLSDETTDRTLDATDNGKKFHNTSTAGDVVLTLMPAVVDTKFEGYVRQAFNFRFLLDGSTSMFWGDLVINPGGYVESNTPGARMHADCIEANVFSGYPLCGKWTVFVN